MSFIYLVVAAAFLFALILTLRKLIPAYLKWRGQMVVACPENQKVVGIEVDAKYAALTTLRDDENLTLKNCTRWPERQNCGQECLSQVESSPENCLIKNILQTWFRTKSCIYCGRRFEKIHWHDHKPAFLSPTGIFMEWADLRPEEMPEVFKTHKPVCWHCYIAENFRKEYPELVLDRPPKKGKGYTQA